MGHAERIGHGVDVMYETNPHSLLKEMADRHVMVEINLTSNDVILGIEPHYHPLPKYRAAMCRWHSLRTTRASRASTDARYVRAAMEYGLNYLDLKAMVTHLAWSTASCPARVCGRSLTISRV